MLEEPLPEDFAAGPIFHDCLLSDHGLASIHIHLRKIVYTPTVKARIVLVHYDDDLEDHLPGDLPRGGHPPDGLELLCALKRSA